MQSAIKIKRVELFFALFFCHFHCDDKQRQKRKS